MEQYIYPQKSHYIQEAQDYIEYFLKNDEYNTMSTVLHAELKTAVQKEVTVYKDLKITFQDCVFYKKVTLKGNNVVIFDRCTFYEPLIIKEQCNVVIMGGGPTPEREYPELYYDSDHELKRKMIKKRYPSEIHNKIKAVDSNVWIYDTEWFNDKGQTVVEGNNIILKIEGKHYPQQQIHNFKSLLGVKNSKVLIENFKFKQQRPISVYNSIITLNNVEGQCSQDVFSECVYNDIRIHNSKFKSPASFLNKSENNLITYDTTVFDESSDSEYMELIDPYEKIEDSKYFEQLSYEYTYNLKTADRVGEGNYLDASELDVQLYFLKESTTNTIYFKNVYFGAVMQKYWHDDCEYNNIHIHKCAFASPFMNTTKGSYNKLTQTFTGSASVLVLFDVYKTELNFENCSFVNHPFQVFKGNESSFKFIKCDIANTNGNAFETQNSKIELNYSTITNTIGDVFFTTSTNIILRNTNISTTMSNIFNGSDNSVQILSSSISIITNNIILATNSSFSIYKTTFSEIGGNAIYGTDNKLAIYKSTFATIGSSFLDGSRHKLTMKKSAVNNSPNCFKGNNHVLNLNKNSFLIFSKHFDITNSSIIDEQGNYQMAPSSSTNGCDIAFTKTTFLLLSTFTHSGDRITHMDVSYNGTPMQHFFNNCQFTSMRTSYIMPSMQTFDSTSSIIHSQTGIDSIIITNSSGITLYSSPALLVTVNDSRLDLCSSNITTLSYGDVVSNVDNGTFANGEIWIGSPVINLKGDTFIKAAHNLTIELGNLNLLAGNVLLNGNILQSGSIYTTGNVSSMGRVFGKTGLFTLNPSQKKPMHTH